MILHVRKKWRQRRFSIVPYLLACCTGLFIANSSVAQNIPGARISSLGGAGITLEDVWSGFHNQAGLTGLEGISAGVFIENRFAMKELSDKGLTIAMPIGNSAIAINYRSFGYSAFNNSKAGLAYALRLAEKFSMGVQLNYHSTRIGENYGTANTMSFEGGFLYKMTENLRLAGHISNPSRAKLAEFNDERIPSLMRLGAGYHFSDKVMLTTEIRKASDSKASVRAGLEYRVIEPLALRIGLGTDPAQYAFGFGYRLSTFQLDVAAGYHPLLGFTPQLSLTYSGKKN